MDVRQYILSNESNVPTYIIIFYTVYEKKGFICFKCLEILSDFDISI